MKISKKTGQSRGFALRTRHRTAPAGIALLSLLSGPVAASRAATLTVDSGSGNSPYAITASQSYSTIYDGTTNTGVINQTGSTAYAVTDTGNLEIGYDASSTGGTYNLSIGTLSVTGTLQVSDDNNTSLFNQTGGTVTAGSVSLTGYSTSSKGTYTLSGGTLITSIVTEGDNSVVGTSTFNFNGGTLQASAASTTFMTGLTSAKVQAGGAIINTSSFAVTIGQALIHDTALGTTADGGLTVQGTTNGQLTLSGANTFNGPTTISNGSTLALASVGALGSTSSITLNGTGVGYYSIVGLSGNVVNTSATLTLNGTSAFQAEGDPLTVASLTGVAGTKLYIGDYVISPTTYAGPFTVGNATSTTFAGVVVGTAASGTLFTKVGAGTLTLSGANTYTGPTAINGGVLQAASAQTGTTSGPLGASGTISFGGGTLQYSSANQFDYSSRFSTAASQAYSIDTNGQNVTFATALTSSGGSLTKIGTGTLTLSGTNTYTGGTNIDGGVLALNNSSALGIGTGNNILFLGGTLQYSANNTTDYSNRFGTTANQALSIDTNGQNVTFASKFSPSSGGTLTKLGTGVLTLSSSSSIFSGGTTITAGTLLLDNTSQTATASATGTGGVSIGTAGTLASTAGSTKGFVTGLVTTAGTTSIIAPGATTTANYGTVGALTLAGGLNLANGATIPFDLGSTSDQIKITGGTFTGGTNSGSITFNFHTTATSGTYALVTYGGATASGVDLTDFANSGATGYFTFNGNELDFTISVVPEPGTFLGGALLVGAAGWNQRRRVRWLFAGLWSKAMA